MTHVHYKFSSKLSYDTVVFDGPHVTLRDLKRQIMGREKLRAADCDLQITNAQSKEEYTDDEGLIPKGSSVIVRRIPISGGKSSSSSKTNNIESSAVQFHHACGAIKAMEDQSSSRALPFFAKMTNLAEADVSEEDKIKVMLNQSTYDSMNYNKKFGSVLPANYTCYRCGNTGHHIRNCPTSGQDKNFEAPLRIKKSTGIPRSFMVEVDDPNIKGAMLTNSGRYAIPAIDAEAYAIGKKEKPPFIPQEKLKSEPEEDPAPDELLCLICHDLLSDAVVIPCCGNSYCDDCIRTTLLDSEEHVCPTCGQSDVSPDTLIANKFLRQAVNNYRKEQGHTKSQKRSCGASESQNITTRPSPVPTLPPITGQSQPQKPHQPTYSQQINLDSVQHHPPTHAADTLPLSGVPPAAKDPTSACSTASTSILPEQGPLEMPKEAEEKTQDDSATAVAALSVLVSDKEPTAAPAQLIPVVNRTIVTEQPQTVSLNQQQSSSSLGTTPSPCVPPTCWDSSSSSSGHPTRGWTESQQLPPSSSSYSATTPPLFPSPLFLSAHQSHHGYPPGYQPTTSLWPVPSPQGAPIPSLCSSTSTSSIPSLIPDEWYRHQRKKKERSPHRGSTYRRSSSNSNSKSSKSKSSRPYSKSSSRSRSRSRSRSQGRSRHQPQTSSHSRHRDLHNRSHLSSSYSYGYKRSHSPTPSSSSSPQVGYYSRSKSPSDHQKKRHHMRHQSKKSSSSSCNSRRRGERSERETGGSEAGLAPRLYAQHPNQAASLDLDRERYLQWKKEYKEWCDKYFSSYAGHFHQLPLPLLNLPPPPLPPPPPQWVDRGPSKKHSHAHSESVCQPQGKRTTQMDDHSPSSHSSSDSRSPPSQSSSGSHSTASQLFSDSSSSSCTSNNSRSPPSQSSSDGRSTPSEDGTQSRAYQQKYSHLPIPLSKGLEEVGGRERSKNDKEVNAKNLEDFSTKRHDSRNVRRREEGRGEETSPAVAGSADNSRTDERMHGNGPNACKDGTSVQDEATTRDTLTSVQRPLIPKKSLDKHCEGESREQSNLKGENRWRRGQHSDVRHDVGRPHKVKPSKEADRLDTGRHRNPGDRKTADTRSENNRKRKGEEVERTKTRNTESPNPFDGKKQKNEKKKEINIQPLTERDIWEEGIKVKPQKKISININLDGKREKHDQELSFTKSFAGKTKEQTEKTENEEEKLNKDHEAKLTAHKEFSREKEGMWEEIIKPGEAEANKMWEKNAFKEVEIWDKFAAEEEDGGEKTKDREDEDFDLWHCALRGVVEEKESERMTEKGREENIGNESQGQEMTELVQNSQKERTDGKSTSNNNKEISLEESKSNREELPVEGVRRTIQRKENPTRYEEQSSRHKSHHGGSNAAMEPGSRCKDHQERRTVVKTLEYPRDTVREGERIFTKVPLSKLDKESDQVEQDKEEVSARDALPVCVPPPLVLPKNQETKGENDQQTWRSVDIERDGDSQRERGRFMQKDATLPGINRAVAPSSGKHRTDSTLCTDGERERRMELEGGRHSERRRESEGKSERQKEKKKSKEKRREEERGRYWGSERSHSSTVSDQRRNHPSSGLFSSSSERSYYAPSGKHSSSERKEGSSKSRAVELPDKNAYTTHREESKSKDRNPHSHKDSSRNYHHQDRPAGTHHSPPSLSHTQGKDRDPLSFSLKPRMSSPSWELIQNRSRDESKEEKGEWKPNKLDKVIRDGKSDRETREVEDERDGGKRWEEEEANKLAGGSKWEEGRELEEGERSSSRSSNSSSSASLENTMDDRRQERKHKKHRKEKRQAVSELQEETELQKHKKSKQSRDSGGEEDDPTRPFSVTFS